MLRCMTMKNDAFIGAGSGIALSFPLVMFTIGIWGMTGESKILHLATSFIVLFVVVTAIYGVLEHASDKI